jgi:putative ABC transport system permease protein
MLDLAFKNVRKQRTRTSLTVIGIVIGITAIVALGSFAEGIDVRIQGELETLTGKIIVTQSGGSMVGGYIGSDITEEQVAMVRSIGGVEDVVPILYYSESGGFGAPQWSAFGIEPEHVELIIGKNIRMTEGARYDEGDHDVALVGSSVAEKYGLKVGDFFTIKNSDFYITGIAEETETGDVDSGIAVPLDDLQAVLGTDNYQIIYVIPEDPRNMESIADEIASADDTLQALTSKEIARQVSELVNNIRIFTIGIGAVATLVGGLGVLNTMIMAVLERRREIGVMKAIGATRRFIVLQILTESSMISMTGGVIGLFLGWLVSMGFGALTGGFAMPILTPALAAGSLAFALALGVFGGLYPAWKAASLDPVDALRG